MIVIRGERLTIILDLVYLLAGVLIHVYAAMILDTRP